VIFWLIIALQLLGGFGTYLFGMSETIAKQATEANDAQNIKNPHIGWMIGFLFLVSFIGLFALVPLRKVKPSPLVFYTLLCCSITFVPTNRPLESLYQIMIIDYKLTYPSGTATAYLINGFHTPEGAKLAK
jgi:cell division protein FtsW (lipid II flippase)